MKLRPVKVFPEPELSQKVTPVSTLGHTIISPTIGEAYPEVVYRILTNGVLIPNAQGSMFQELLDFKIVITDEDPNNLYHPDYLPFTKEYINTYISQLIECSQDTTTYTYGDRLRKSLGIDQIYKVIQQLKDDVYTTRAVMNLWDAVTDGVSGSPCLNTIIVKTVNGALCLTAIFRSNDMYSAWAANAMQLRALQEYIRVNVDPMLKLGTLTTISNSAHIYEQALEPATKLIPEYRKLAKKLKRSYQDPIGNFVLTDKDLVLWYKDVPINSYNVEKDSLYDILADYPNIEKTHLIYLSQYFK